ncbi:MAG: sensor histidine kinase N-terminal domain-containing protein [Dokdonella sp.]
MRRLRNIELDTRTRGGPFASRGRPSLHRQLLKLLLVPMLAALIVDAALIYMAALAYTNHVHDRDLIEDAMALAGVAASELAPGELSRQARFLLEYDHEQLDFFRIASSRAGVLTQNGRLQPPPPRPDVTDAGVLSDSRVGDHAVRVATVAVPSQRGGGEILWVSMAETLHERRIQAREILIIAAPMLGLLIIVVLLLVWFGVSRGLRLIDRLTARLAAQPDGVLTITDAEVPHELLPLTRTIDELFAKLRGVIVTQERFIADAAHQLRTPLAGLSLHVQRALSDSSASTLSESLMHIDELSQRAARTSSQLLTLSRADSSASHALEQTCFDAVRLLTEAVAQRVDEALTRHIDLGYDGVTTPFLLDGNVGLFLDLIDNLLDNALRYSGDGSSITVSLHRDGPDALLVVEDNGPGVADIHLSRLGERFFREPGQAEPGTGLGLAIVSQIANHFGAGLRFLHGRQHRGLRVEVALSESKGG